jgi:uncharacterized phiE125 gp8 family phage protein
MNLTRVAAPAVAPVTITEAREHLRVIDEGEDSLITGQIEAATQYLDGRTGILGRALVTQVWDLKLQRFPGAHDAIRLPFPPLQAIVSVKYFDSDDVEQTLAETDYDVQPGEFAPVLRRADDIAWPWDCSPKPWPITIRFRAGYGDVAAQVPRPLRQAMLLMIGHWYENRSAVEACELNEVPMAVKALLSPYLVSELAL